MGIYDCDGYINCQDWASQQPVSEIILHRDDALGDSIPIYFDIRNKIDGELTIRDKGKTPEGIGICWLFAAQDILETYLLYCLKLKQNQILPQSTLHGAYSTFDLSSYITDLSVNKKDYENPRGRKPGVKKDEQHKGKPAYGGHLYMAVNYLTRDMGTTPERIDPYHKEAMTGQVLPQRKWNITEQKPGCCYVKSVRYLPNPIPPGGDAEYIDTIKRNLIRYGGIACSIFWDDQYVQSLEDGDYTYHNNTPGRNRNHAVVIIGWDDSYPVNNFKYKPGRPGAYLVKNCWAAEKAGRYFWVSYECGNFGMDPYCITDVGTDLYSDTYKILQYDLYGYNNLYPPYTEGKRVQSAQNVFRAARGSSLVGVSFYVCSASYVYIEYQMGDSEIELAVKDMPCDTPGYYTYTFPQAVALKDEKFAIIITYVSATNLPAYIPLEINDEPEDEKIYTHWNIQRGCSFVCQDEDWLDVADLNEEYEYGYFCMKAIIYDTSDTAKKIKDAYDALSMPEIHDGCTELLPQKIQDIPIQWRLEPYEDGTAAKNGGVVMYSVGGSGRERYGLVNTGSAGQDVFLTAVLGSGAVCMRKIFMIHLGVTSKSYSFDATDALEHEDYAELNGKFDIPEAVVTVEANGRSEEITVKDDGSWQIKEFRLYDVKKGWDKKYENTEVTVRFKSADGYTLAEGKKTVKAKNPAEKKDDNSWVVFTIAGLAAALVAGGIIYIKAKLETEKRGKGYLPLPASPGAQIIGSEETSILSDEEFAVFEEVSDVSDVVIQRRANIEKHSDERTKNGKCYGVIANRISKGGSVKRCRVTGEIHDSADVGGLFYQGEDVTVEGCTVDLKVDGAGIYAGAAVSLKGAKNCIRNTSINGVVSAKGTAAGIVCNMEGGTISDCRVSGVFAGADGAYGVAANMNAAVQIRNCYSACALTADKTEARVCGIAYGVENAADHISACVVAGSHFSAAHTARVSFFPAQNCTAYDMMTSSGAFEDTGINLQPASAFHERDLYEKLGWNFNDLWNMGEYECFPVLKMNPGQLYDYPFPYPLTPDKTHRFVYKPGDVIALIGKCNTFFGNKMKWSISLLGSGKEEELSGKVMAKKDEFYLQMMSLYQTGKYDFTLFSIYEEHKYGISIMMEVE